VPRKCDKTQIDRIQHKLQAEKHRDDVLFDNEAYGSYGKKQHAQDKVM
jgi:hypothetical protein